MVLLWKTNSAAMLAALLTLALLPLALAACPCPPAPAAATVCGSNNKTYPSACDLDCTAPPGVAAAHPGPCHPEDASLTIRGSSLRSASEDRQKINTCKKERKCDKAEAVCSECGQFDWGCQHMCRRNCLCGCLGVDASLLDDHVFSACSKERDCYGKMDACHKNCFTQECKDSCWLEWQRCDCECSQQAGGSSAPPTPPTASTTAGTGTGTTTAGTGTTAPSTGTTPPAKRAWDQCIRQRLCDLDGCSGCRGDDGDCQEMCYLNCCCGCMGVYAAGLNWRAWKECRQQEKCSEKYLTCRDSCGAQQDESCKDSCFMEDLGCSCTCSQRAGGLTLPTSAATLTVTAASSPVTANSGTVTTANIPVTPTSDTVTKPSSNRGAAGAAPAALAVWTAMSLVRLGAARDPRAMHI